MVLRKNSAFMALAVLLGILISKPARAVEVETHNIPTHLEECYHNNSLYFRENRLPSSMPMVISILRQIEESPGFIMDLRSFALSLLHMFRVDGVERNPEVMASEHTIPFGLTGSQYYKYKLLMNGLIPRSSFLFPNETLTDREKCSLHFMMSDSLDKPQRGDEHETCRVAAQYRAGTTQRRQRRSVGDDNSDHSDHADHADHVDHVDHADSETINTVVADTEVETVPQSGGDSAHVGTDDQDQSAPPVEAGPAPDNPDAEILDLPASKESPTAKDRKGDLMWNMDGEGPLMHGQIRAAPGTSAKIETPLSDCPVENGVVYARWGSVQLGTVLAGIATGFETQRVQLKDLRKNPLSKFTNPQAASTTVEIDNRYAATLAGDLAEIALWRGPKAAISIGASGNWNNTKSPRWYFIKEANEMTDAEVRGGLDGLIMADKVKEWNNKANGQLKLSTLLERYYSARGVFDEEYRACERQSHYKRVADSNVMRSQTTNFGYLLYDTTPGIATIKIEGVEAYASQALEILDQTIRGSSQMEVRCENLGRSSDEMESTAKSDIIFVVDCTWAEEQINDLLSSLANLLDLQPLSSSITVYGAKNFELLFEKSHRAHTFADNLRENRTEYQNCKQGVDLQSLLDTHLRKIYFEQLMQEKEEKEAAIQSQTVVIMPYNNYDLQGQEYREVEKLVDEYRRIFPDVTFIIFTRTKKENFNVIVQNSDEDIIDFNNYANDIDADPLVSRLNKEYRRIANPTCGIDWQDSDYGSLSKYDNVPFRTTAFYRINQKYLFGASRVVIQIKEENTGTIGVCYSRRVEYPTNDESSENSDIVCGDVSNGPYEIAINSPCESSKNIQQCSPLYISVSAKESKMQCKDNTCQDVDDISISITHTGLTCGAAAVLTTPLLGAIALLTLLKSLI